MWFPGSSLNAAAPHVDLERITSFGFREVDMLQKALEGIKRKATLRESRAQADHVRMLQVCPCECYRMIKISGNYITV